MASLAGTRIDKYDMIEEVGHGGMAVVYRGLDRVLNREVAVKILHPHLADRKESRLRLQREALAVAKLRHENILEIFDYSGPGAEASYIVTEFIHGVTLKEWVDDTLKPRPAIAALIVYRLCLALHHAHRSGIVHRDIKPENVMIRNDGVLKLMDFGIAQIIDNQKLTLTGQLIGSPAYMAPELIRGQPLDHRTDLFSLGILLYQLATGRLPFTGRNPHEVLNRIADGDYPPAATLCPLVDRDLEEIIALSLASDPDDRYQSVDTLAKALASYLEEMGVDPSSEDLSRYFRDPQASVVELDDRICTTLTATATTTAGTGDTARAIRLLGRVLELHHAHPGALRLLERLRRRERRRKRWLLFGAGGFVTAAALLLLYSVPQGAPLDIEQPGPVVTHSASLDRTVAEPTTAFYPAVLESRDPPMGTAGLPDAVSGEVSSTEEPSMAVPDQPPPDVRSPVRKKSPVEVTRVPSPTACRLQLSGIPLPTAKNLDILVGTTPYRIEAMQMDVEFEGEFTAVRVTDKRYTASRQLTQSECAKGPVGVTIEPRAARVIFEGDPKGLVVVCQSGCRPSLVGRNQNAKDFQPVPLTEGQLQQRVVLELKHREFQARIVEADLLPGPNTLTVTMIPRP